jgi:hypothetical protein
MARSRITAPTRDLITDNGAILASLAEGEQIRLVLRLSWIENLSDYTISAVVVEAQNEGNVVSVADENVPDRIRIDGQVTELDIIDEDPSDNIFEIVFPRTLSDDWLVRPAPNRPVYGFVDLKIADNGVGVNQRIWKPVRGLVEIVYSPTRTL